MITVYKTKINNLTSYLTLGITTSTAGPGTSRGTALVRHLVRHVEVIHHWFPLTLSLHLAVSPHRFRSYLSRLKKKKMGKAVSSEDCLATLYSERD